MAINFGSLFDRAFESTNTFNAKGIEEIGEQFDELIDTITELNDVLEDENISEKERLKLEKQRARLVEEREKIEQAYQLALEDSSTAIKRVEQNWSKVTNRLALEASPALNEFSEQIGEIFRQLSSGELDLRNAGSAFGAAGIGLAGNLIASFSQGTQQGLNEIGDVVVNSAKGLLGSTLAKGFAAGFGPFAPVVEKAFDQVFDAIVGGVKQAYQQIVSLNNDLTNLMRQTGGLVTAQSLGFSKGGMGAGGRSLRTMTIDANVDIGDFTGSISQLTKGLGNVAGTVDFFAERNQKALVDFGIEAAKMKKYYDADIGPAVRGLISDFGFDVGKATNTMVDGVMKAKKAGLDPGKFAENMQEAVKQAGKLHFKQGVQGMEKMAMLATQLGTSVEGVIAGMTKMKGINDLFVKQQEAQSLGMHNVAQNLSKIYALQKQGLHAEAAQVEQAALLADLRQGMIDNMGQITQEGIDYLDALGKSQDDIANLQKLAVSSTKSGLSVEKLLASPDELTPEERKKRTTAEREGMTFEEKFNQILGKFVQTFIDPLAQLAEGFLDPLLTVGETLLASIATPLQMLFSMLSVAFVPVIVIFEQIGKLLSDVFSPLASIAKGLQAQLGGFLDILKQAITAIIKWIMVPVRMIGKTIGFVFGLIGDVFSVFFEAIQPIIDIFKDLFGIVSDGSESLLDGFQSFLDVIRENIIPVIRILLKPIEFLANIISLAYKAVKGFIDGVMEFVDWVLGFFKIDFVGLAAQGAAEQFNWQTALAGGQRTDVTAPAQSGLMSREFINVSKEQRENELALRGSFPPSSAPEVHVNVETDWVGVVKHKSTRVTP